jgi:5'-nucleotidase
MHILITNDDGINAKGIRELIGIAKKIADKITVVAPDAVRSGSGMAIPSLHSSIFCELVKEEDNYKEFVCSGSPVECVKLALILPLKNDKPDLILSGINHGSNAASNLLYSGTMGAALEGSICNIRSIGFSLLDYADDADFDAAKPYIEDIITKIIDADLPTNITYNVNIPAVPSEEIKGIKVCCQASAFWEESFIEVADEKGKVGFQLRGDFFYQNDQPESDVHALNDGYIAIVPVQFDLTAYKHLKDLREKF